MSDFRKQYQEKKMSAHDAVRLVKNGETIVVPTGAGEPPALLTALSERRREFRGVTVSQILPLRKFEYLQQETAENIRHSAYFLGGATRPGAQAAWCDYIPNYFSEMPMMIRQGLLPTDVVFTLASRMDKFGNFAISLGTDYTMDAIKRARVVVLEVNEHVPFTYGKCHVNINQVTAIVENHEPVIEVGLPKIGPTEEAIGKYVAELIPDGATLQIGYGAIPDAVVMQLSNKHDLGIHTEMIGDGIMSMIEAGVVTNRKKNYMPGVMPATFALGSKKLYEFMDLNPMLEMHPVDFTNDVYLASSNDNLISINATMQVDLIGQCGSENIGHLPYSGTGGQSDFVRAANRSKGGKSFIVTPSTAKNGTVSRIVTALAAGTHVTTSKNDVSYVVTEFGVAHLRGRSAQERARALIAIAHPDFRDQLQEDARRLKILP